MIPGSKKIKNRNFYRRKNKNKNNPDIKPNTETFLSGIKPKTEIILPETKPAIKPFPIDRPIPALADNVDNIDGQTEIFVDDSYQSWIDGNQTDTKPDLTFPTPTGKNVTDEINYDTWVNNLQNIRPDLFLSDDVENLDQQTEMFVDDSYPSLAGDLPDIKPDIKPDVKTNIILKDVSDTDTIDYTSDIGFIKKVPQDPRDRLKRKIKRKRIKRKKTKPKKAKNKHSKSN